jgi:hypothetical protein
MDLAFNAVQGIGFLHVCDAVNTINFDTEMQDNIRDALRRYMGLYIARLALMDQGQPVPSSLTLPLNFELKTPLDFSRAYSKYNKKGVTQ